MVWCGVTLGFNVYEPVKARNTLRGVVGLSSEHLAELPFDVFLQLCQLAFTQVFEQGE